MARPKTEMNTFLALNIVRVYWRLKQDHPDLGLGEYVSRPEFPRHDGAAAQFHRLTLALAHLEQRYGFPFILASVSGGGRSDVAPEAVPILRRFERRCGEFFDPDGTFVPPASRPLRLGAFGIVLGACLVPSLCHLKADGGADWTDATVVDCRFFRRAMRRLIAFRVDAVVGIEDEDLSRTEFKNILAFTPGPLSVPVLRVYRKRDEANVRALPVILTRDCTGQWARYAPRRCPSRGDLTLTSPHDALRYVRMGYGSAVVLGVPEVFSAVAAEDLSATPLEDLAAARLGVYTRHPRERMVRAEVWARVEEVLAACSVVSP